MISETIFNIDAIMPYIIGLSAIILIGIAIFLLHNLGGLKIFSNHDKDMNKIWLEKFPLVNPDFYKKNIKEQLAENNQEIHEKNKRLDKQEAEIEELKEQMSKLIEIVKELKGE